MSDVSCERLRIPLAAPQVLLETSAVSYHPSTDLGAPCVVLAPGAGSDLTNPVLRAVGRGLADAGHPVIVFNFAFTEAGRRRPDPASRLEQAYRDVLAEVAARHPGRPLVLGGRSMGGRIASHLVAQGQPCAGLVLLGYPLHPRPHAGEKVADERLRTGHWPALGVPTLFVQGARDQLCDLALLKRERRAHLQPGRARVHVVAGADHGFGVRKRDGRSPGAVLDEVTRAVAGWLPTIHARV